MAMIVAAGGAAVASGLGYLYNKFTESSLQAEERIEMIRLHRSQTDLETFRLRNVVADKELLLQRGNIEMQTQLFEFYKSLILLITAASLILAAYVWYTWKSKESSRPADVDNAPDGDGQRAIKDKLQLTGLQRQRETHHSQMRHGDAKRYEIEKAVVDLEARRSALTKYLRSLKGQRTSAGDTH